MLRHTVLPALLLSLLPPAGLAGQAGAARPRAQAPPAHILRLDDAPEELVYQLTTRIRHTTVITLPAGEQILDYVVGDAEYWHLTGSANVAFLKPIAEDVDTNIALVCASGRIYTFLVQETDLVDPHLVVRIEAGGEAQDGDATADGGMREPLFVSREEVRGFELMAAQAQLELAQVRAEALADLDAFRADYPTRIRFAYRFDRDKAESWPWQITGMWHDGQFTYLRSNAQETPALYEEQDGEPSLVPYDLQDDGFYVVRRIVGEGWFQIGDERLEWDFTPPGRER